MRAIVFLLACGSSVLAQATKSLPGPDHEFSQTIRPVLVQNCAACHKPENAKGHAPFLAGCERLGYGDESWIVAQCVGPASQSNDAAARLEADRR